MWRCVNCSENNKDEATACWKCKEPGGADDVDPDQTHLDLLVDPERPVPISETGAVQCPTCGQQFRVNRDDSSTVRARTDRALCPYCSHGITPGSLLRVTASRGEEAGTAKEIIFACPYCGKVLGVQEP